METLIFTSGSALAIFGASLAATLGGIGSAIGCGYAGQAACGITSEKPELSPKLLVLEVLPGSQAIYGLVGAFLVTIFFSVSELTSSQGAQIFQACLPLAFAGLFSGIFQGKVAAAGTQIVAKNPDGLGKAIIFAAIVESVAIFGLLVTFLLLDSIRGSL
ncbi:V-type ATP synthase subunit K [Candidatus Peregrinibacteria bacterium]|nr:MAG: V-type ATP synthase subunit K [Candidatus Peregrinibacteria bacterium]